jgi:hypothetical protein
MKRLVLFVVALFFAFATTVMAEGGSLIQPDKDTYNYGEAITVHFYDAPGNYNDWICIVPVGSPDTDTGDWKYIPSGFRQGALIFDSPSPGQYEVRAYYNYSLNRYVVSDRYAFSVVNDFVEAPPPPPLPFDAPPDVIVMPETNDVYVVPDINVDLFFWNGWWWRPWLGHWYRSLYYNWGWGYYNSIPSFYFDVDPGWRGYYRDRNWYGHRWDYERIPERRLQQNWKSWNSSRHWERQGTWGVRNYQPRPQQQRQELRQQRQKQFQQRPEVQQSRQLQVQQRQVQQSRQPQVQQRQVQQSGQPQVQQRQVQQPGQLQVQQRQVRQPGQPQVKQRQVRQPGQPQVKQQRRQSQEKPEKREVEQ